MTGFVHVCLQVGPSVQKYLPDDLNPKIKEQLDNEMGGGGSNMGAAPPQGPPAAPAPSSKPKAAANGKKKSDTDRIAAQPAQAAPVQKGAHEQQLAAVGKLAGDLWHSVVCQSLVQLFSTCNKALVLGDGLCVLTVVLCPDLRCHPLSSLCKQGTGSGSYSRLQGKIGKAKAGQERQSKIGEDKAG